MARIHNTGFDKPPTSSTEGLHVYNGLDCCMTHEVFEVIHPKLNEITSGVYAHALALQGPILEMECRGVLVDTHTQGSVRALFEQRIKVVEASLAEILDQGLDIQGFNPNSPQQLKVLLYDVLGLPPVRVRGRITTDRKALEKLRSYFYAEQIVAHIIAIRDLRKKIGVLKTGIDADGRIRTSYNIAGTDTGRLNSYASCFGSGTNLQNITGELRNIFVADPGKRLAYIDLEQAESRAVGAIIWNLFQDGTYLDFCESGDLHTSVCRMTFDLPWTGDMKKDKAIAKEKFYRDWDYRDAAKRLGHGSNYGGQAPHMSKETRVPYDNVVEFQRKYFSAFPGIPNWHTWVKTKLYRDGWITTFMGRQRYFMGRRWESDTQRAATAYEPQSAVADYLNKGLLAVWRTGLVELLLQVHDAIVFQYPAEQENEIIPQVQKLIEIEVPLLHGRSLTIPSEAMVGWNWGYASERNPDGLVKFNGNDTRKRSAPMSFMDRKFFAVD